MCAAVRRANDLARGENEAARATSCFPFTSEPWKNRGRFKAEKERALAGGFTSHLLIPVAAMEGGEAGPDLAGGKRRIAVLFGQLLLLLVAGIAVLFRILCPPIAPPAMVCAGCAVADLTRFCI